MAKPAKCFNVKPKNSDQAEAIGYLTDLEVDLVILEGVAGSGKTYLALAAGLAQVLDTKAYKEIIFTRAPVALGNDLGSLPGTEQDKLLPWCGALMDNLEALVGTDDFTKAFIDTKVKIKAMQYMRGRSLQDKYVIIDEAQNLTLGELKVLITRAGEGTKIVLMGDSSQCDNKRIKLNEDALSKMIAAYEFAKVPYIKYVSLPVSERSRLCKWASEVL